MVAVFATLLIACSAGLGFYDVKLVAAEGFSLSATSSFNVFLVCSLECILLHFVGIYECKFQLYQKKS